MTRAQIIFECAPYAAAIIVAASGILLAAGLKIQRDRQMDHWVDHLLSIWAD